MMDLSDGEKTFDGTRITRGDERLGGGHPRGTVSWKAQNQHGPPLHEKYRIASVIHPNTRLFLLQ